jgi:hypothetical protein
MIVRRGRGPHELRSNLALRFVGIAAGRRKHGYRINMIGECARLVPLVTM